MRALNARGEVFARACCALDCREPVDIDAPLRQLTSAATGAVRGGVRGSAITPEFVDYERRQAAAMGMPLKAWQTVAAS